MRTLLVDSRVSGNRSRLLPIGSSGNTVFVKVSREECVEIWSLHTLFPDSWKKICSYDLIELYYSYAAFSLDEKRIFLLVFGTSLSNEEEVNMYEIDHRTGESTMYPLDTSFAAEFYSLPFEAACLSHGKNGLHIYDRGIIMGNIPFWYIELGEASFSITRSDILDTDDLKCVRFPIPIDSGSKLFARLLSDNTLVLFRQDTGKWEKYIQSTESIFNLLKLESRGISETYSRAGGHRMGAVQSPLSIYSDGTTVIAKVTRWKINHFYRVLFDHAKKEFTCLPVGRARFTAGLDQMFYATVRPNKFIAVGVRAIGVVELKPPSLLELALWAVQLTSVKTGEAGTQTGGHSFGFLQKTFGTSIMSSFLL